MVELDNQRYSYVLSIIDCFSRFLWLRALTNKQSKTVAGKSEQNEFSYDRVSYEWSLPWNNFNYSGRQGVRVSYTLVITKPCNPPVDTGLDEENIACCSVTNSYENA